MAYCQNCGNKLKESAKFCHSCGQQILINSVRETLQQPQQIIKEIHHKRSSGIGIFLFILILLIIIGGVLYFANQKGGISGAVSRVIDPCDRQFDECNRACGEGWFNGLCKSGCTLDYNECKKKS